MDEQIMIQFISILKIMFILLNITGKYIIKHGIY